MPRTAGLRRSAIAVASCLLAACLLAACGSSHPAAAPSTSTSPSVTRSATPTRATHTPHTGRATPVKPTKRTSPRPTPTPTPTTSAPAQGPLVLLNPGHNGQDAAHPEIINQPIDAGFGRTKACETTGTSTNSGYPEHAFNWDVTLRVRSILEAHGVRVIMTRPNDDGVGPCANVRAQLGNRPDVAAQISIHADGASSSGHGFHVCEDSRQPAGPAIAAESHRLTVAVHDALLAGSGMTVSSYLGQDGYFPRDDLTGLNLAMRPATFLELGNMRNAGDAELQMSPSGRGRIAIAVATGILAYLGR